MKPPRPSFPTFRFYATDDAGNEHVTGDGDFPNGVAAIRHYAEAGGFEIAEHGPQDASSATATLRDEGRTFKLRAVLVDAQTAALDQTITLTPDQIAATTKALRQRKSKLGRSVADAEAAHVAGRTIQRGTHERNIDELNAVCDVLGALDVARREIQSRIRQSLGMEERTT